MTGDFVSSFQERIGRYEREDSIARGQLPASDPAHYLRGVQNVRERTNRWNADRLRSGVRRVAGISYGDTVPVPDPSQAIRLAPGPDVVALHREMRRARDASISRRREPKVQPRLESLQGQKIVVPAQEAMPPVSLSSPEGEPPQVDLDILHRLLQTPSRILSKSSSPFARLSPGGGSEVPNGTVSAPLCAPSPPARQVSRLPPVRGRLLPMTLARGARLRPQEALRATKLPAITDGSKVWRQNGGFSRSHTDLHGFKIYQHLLGGGGDGHRQRRGFPTPSLAHVSGDSVPLPLPQEEGSKGVLPVPSFPITQLLAASEPKTPRVDYISINIALPRTDQSRPQTPSNTAFDVAGPSFVPPPSPATLRPEGEEEEEEGEEEAEEEAEEEEKEANEEKEEVEEEED